MPKRRTRRRRRKRKGGRGPCPRDICACGTFDYKCKSARSVGRAYWFNHKNGGMEAVNKDATLSKKRAKFVADGKIRAAKQAADAITRQEDLSALSKQKGLLGDAAFLQQKIQSKLGGKRRKSRRKKRRKSRKKRRRSRKRRR